MRNQLAEGAVLNVKAPKKLVSGELFIFGDLLLVAATAVDKDELVAARREGLFLLQKASEPVTEGAIAYFDGKILTPKASHKQGEKEVAHARIGYFMKSAEKAEVDVEVLLSQ